MQEISFRSPVPPEECACRLKGATEPDRGGWFEDLNRSHVVLARFNHQRVRLRVRRPYSRNALAPLFYGRFEATSGGTLIRGRFRPHLAVLIFVVVWFSFILVVGCGIFLNTGAALPLLMIGLVAALLWFLCRLGRAERKDIVHLIQHTLSATTHETAKLPSRVEHETS